MIPTHHQDPIVVITPAMMRNGADCALSCIEMLLGRTYADVLSAVAPRYRKDVGGVGYSEAQIRNIAKRLGVALAVRRIVTLDDIDDDEAGLLSLQRDDNTEGHYVVYAKHTLYNPAQGQWWWDPDSYLKQGRWIPWAFISRKG